jgi:glycine/D-amino acid oxidase-like deaminating enzyme
MPDYPKKVSLIIIGAGMTGLSAALAYVKNNDPLKNQCILLEKNRIEGGYVSTYKRSVL